MQFMGQLRRIDVNADAPPENGIGRLGLLYGPILDEAIRIHGRSSEILFGDLIAVCCSGESLL